MLDNAMLIKLGISMLRVEKATYILREKLGIHGEVPMKIEGIVTEERLQTNYLRTN